MGLYLNIASNFGALYNLYSVSGVLGSVLWMPWVNCAFGIKHLLPSFYVCKHPDQWLKLFPPDLCFYQLLFSFLSEKTPELWFQIGKLSVEKYIKKTKKLLCKGNSSDTAMDNIMRKPVIWVSHKLQKTFVGEARQTKAKHLQLFFQQLPNATERSL